MLYENIAEKYFASDTLRTQFSCKYPRPLLPFIPLPFPLHPTAIFVLFRTFQKTLKYIYIYIYSREDCLLHQESRIKLLLLLGHP